MGIATRMAFENNVENFLRDHVVEVRGGWRSPTTSPGGTVRQAAGAPVFALGDQRTAVSLNAPLLEAYFEVVNLPVEPHIFRFSKPKVRVTLDAPGTNQKALPVYLIPFKQHTGHGVKLPDQATDNLPVAYAVTSAQNGCTVEVSGPRGSPYASHTNVADAMDGHRQALIHARVAQLQADYLAAEQAAGLPLGAPNPAAVNRVQFGHDQGPGGGVTHHNYSAHSFAIAQNRLTRQGNAVTIKSAQRQGLGIRGHSNFRYQIAPGEAVLNPALVSEAQVVAKRAHGDWTFYYQIWNLIKFSITEKDKWLNYTYDTRNRTADVRVVLAWGQLWPNYSQFTVVF